MPRKKKTEVIQEERQHEVQAMASQLARMMSQNSILDDIIEGYSQEQIAVNHGLSLAEVQDIVRGLFVDATERHAGLRSRIGMMSIMRYESLIQIIMPYVRGTEVLDVDGKAALMPPDPRFIKLMIDIIKEENNIFKDERAIIAKTEGLETKDGFQKIEETMVTGDDLYKSASALMSAQGYVPTDYADLTPADMLAAMEMRGMDEEESNGVVEKVKHIGMSDTEIMEELRRRRIVKEDEQE